MPTYCYSNGHGDTEERVYDFGKAPASFTKTVRGVRLKFSRDYIAESCSVPPTSGWPMPECYASGVHADQAQELRDHFKKHGVDIQVTNDGNPIYESSAQRKRALKCRGMHDRASFT